MKIILEKYNPDWKNTFEKEKDLLQNVLQDLQIKVEHIGSTAIPHVCAKPVIDILLGVSNLNLLTQDHIDRIQSLGYQYVPLFEKHLPFRRFFQKDNEKGQRTHQIHLCTHPSAWWSKHILFRDYLRAYSEKAENYSQMKLELAAAINHHYGDANSQAKFYEKYIQPYPYLIEEYRQLQELLSEKIALSNPYPLAKTPLIRNIDKKAYFDAEIHRPDIQLNDFNGYIPALACLESYLSMLKNEKFIACYGVAYNDQQIQERLISDMNHWDEFGSGPWMWFEKENFNYVGRAGLKTFIKNNKPEIELTFSIQPQYWGEGISVKMGLVALDYGFNKLNLNSIICFTHEKNSQSRRVIEKLGFNYEDDFIYQDSLYNSFRMDNKK